MLLRTRVIRLAVVVVFTAVVIFSLATFPSSSAAPQCQSHTLRHTVRLGRKRFYATSHPRFKRDLTKPPGSRHRHNQQIPPLESSMYMSSLWISICVPQLIPTNDIHSPPSNIDPAGPSDHSRRHLILVTIQRIVLTFLCKKEPKPASGQRGAGSGGGRDDRSHLWKHSSGRSPLTPRVPPKDKRPPVRTGATCKTKS